MNCCPSALKLHFVSRCLLCSNLAEGACTYTYMQTCARKHTHVNAHTVQLHTLTSHPHSATNTHATTRTYIKPTQTHPQNYTHIHHLYKLKYTPTHAADI